MARKKRDGPVDEPSTNGTHEATVVADVPETPPTQPPPAQPAPEANGKPKPNRPAAAFAAHSDRTTKLEIAVWSDVVKVSEAEEYTRFTLTMSRSWCDKDGNWRGNGGFRLHDIPVLLYLVQQAYNWCVAQRTTVHIETTEPLPF